jgi:hypothetical protein
MSFLAITSAYIMQNNVPARVRAYFESGKGWGNQSTRYVYAVVALGVLDSNSRYSGPQALL